jgi:hypothetical protein
MLLNANMLLFSGLVPWFDVRLNGENDDPLKMTAETLAATWNGWGQGVQSLGEWRPSQDSRSILDLLTILMVPSPLDGARLTLEDWSTSQAPELAVAREMWGYWRFFGLNGAHRFSSFEASDVIAMTEPGSMVNGFSRDGRVLAVMGVPGGHGMRPDKLKVLAPGRLGLREGVRYRLVDMRNNRYLSDGSYSISDLAQIPVTLAGTEPLILLIEPELKGPRIVYFKGADQILTTGSGRKLELRIKAVPGSPLEIHVDTAGEEYHSETAGLARRLVPGVFAVFAGTVPNDAVVILSK